MRFVASLARNPLGALTVILALATRIEARADLQKFFTSNGKVVKYFPNDGPDKNGCKDHVPALESSYKQAADMVDSAVNALDILSRPANPPDNQQALSDWVTKAQTMFAYFGIKIDVAKGGPLSGDVTQLNAWNDVNKIFKLMKAGFDNDDVGASTRKPGLYCGTQAWTYLKPTDNDPNAAGKTIADKKDGSGKSLFPNGVWHWNLNYKWGKTSQANPPNPQGHNICVRNNELALTNPNLDIITWCDFAFAQSTNIPATTIDPKNAKEGDSLDDRQKFITLSRTWVHELAHFYGANTRQGLSSGLPDQPAVNWDGTPEGSGKVVYGVGRVINYAHVKNTGAVNTADSYAAFALAMQQNAWDWADGKAQKIQ